MNEERFLSEPHECECSVIDSCRRGRGRPFRCTRRGLIRGGWGLGRAATTEHPGQTDEQRRLECGVPWNPGPRCGRPDSHESPSRYRRPATIILYHHANKVPGVPGSVTDRDSPISCRARYSGPQQPVNPCNCTRRFRLPSSRERWPVSPRTCSGSTLSRARWYSSSRSGPHGFG